MEIVLTAGSTIGMWHAITVPWLFDSESVAHENSESSYRPVEWSAGLTIQLGVHSTEGVLQVTEGALSRSGG